MRFLTGVVAVSSLLAAAAGAAPAAAAPGAGEGAGGPAAVSHGLSIYGDLKYPPDFTHFDYVNPAAPKGGDVQLSAVGTFDSLNPFVLKGVPANGLGLTFATLLAGADDEPASAYGYVAESVEVPEDRSWAIFTLRPEARFHDGTPITADDVIFSLEALQTEGHPFYRAYYASVEKAEKVGERRVKFTFAGGYNRELPYIVGDGLPILSRTYFAERDFGETTLETVLGSGPYRVESVEPGRSVTYARVRDWWGADLPVNRGQYNFDTLRYDYYRDATVALEAFKAGEYDFRQENTAKVWATGYDFPALDQGLVKKEEIPNEIPTGMQAFVFNTRLDIFKNPQVRRALAHAFDFEWTNRNLFYGAYVRTESFFSNSPLAASGLPQGEELEILERFRGRVPPEVFTQEYEPPSTDVEGGIRTNLRKARRMLREAGWDLRDGVLVNTETGDPMRFEILLVNPQFERIVGPFVRNLDRLGVDASIRTIDTSQYQNRIEDFDFEMIVDVFPQSLSPGNEQRDFWTSAAAETPGSRNTIGVKDPVVDELVDMIIAAPDRKALIARCRALDRVLLWHHYVVPHWHITYFRVAYWNKFSRPETTPPYSLGFNTWWVDRTKLAQLDDVKGETGEDPSTAARARQRERTLTVLGGLIGALFVLWLGRRMWARHRGRR